MNQTIPNSEFPRSIDVSDLPSHGLDISVQATLVEREALCQRFELEELRALEAHVRVIWGPWSLRRMWYSRSTFNAAVGHTNGVSGIH